MIQAVYRARHTRRIEGREPVLILAASERPSIPGVVWEDAPAPTGHANAARGLAYEMLCHVAAETGRIGVSAIAEYDWRRYHVHDPIAKINRHALEDAIRAFLEDNPHWSPLISAGAPRAAGRPPRVWTLGGREPAETAAQSTAAAG